MYDSKCYDLAEYFLPNADEKHKRELAQIIQDAVEGYEIPCAANKADSANIDGDERGGDDDDPARDPTNWPENIR